MNYLNKNKMEKNKVPIAEEFLLIKTGAISRSITDAMIEFAKLHVKAALEAAAESAVANFICYPRDVIDDLEVDRDSILNAYPDELIK